MVSAAIPASPESVFTHGYTEPDVPDLVDGAMRQQRLLATAPRPVTRDDVAGSLTRSVSLW